MKENTIIQLFSYPEECCACGACMNICPTGAIKMKEDQFGFIFPEIQEVLCVKCGACKRVCAYQNDIERSTVTDVFVAVNNNKQQVMHSASGGAFAAIADKVLEQDGIVYGAAYDSNGSTLQVKHIGIMTKADLPRLQGSKYVQSEIGFVYKEIRAELLKGKIVLFSGTPCQVAGLKGYLDREYENLFTVDLICHGVPSQSFFKSYIQYLEEKGGGKITDFNFRKKDRGWGDFYIEYESQGSKSSRRHQIYCKLSSYYELFLKSVVYRKSCYSCKYAAEQRVGDLTLGDYWGIERQHSELFRESVWQERRYMGISCILVNSQRGSQLIESIDDNVDLIVSDYKRVSAENGQLKHPSRYSTEREQVLELFSKQGFNAIDTAFHKHMGKRWYKYKLKAIVPIGFKKYIRKVISSRKK